MFAATSDSRLVPINDAKRTHASNGGAVHENDLPSWVSKGRGLHTYPMMSCGRVFRTIYLRSGGSSDFVRERKRNNASLGLSTVVFG